MTEIRLDVELPHPPERVWRAIVDPGRLAGWFFPNDLRPVPGHRFRITPGGQGGFDRPIDAEIIEIEQPRRLAMRWLAPELDARVAFSLTRVTGGTRLTMRQTGFFGMQGLLRRRVLQSVYTEMLGRRLPEVLDRLATEDGRRGAVGAALARRRAQRNRGADGGGRRNMARPFRRRNSIGRRLSAVGRVRVSKPLSLESTLAIAVAALPGRRRARSARRRQPRSGRAEVLVSRFYRVRERIADGLAAVGSAVARPVPDDDDEGGPRPESRNRAVAVGAALLVTVGLVLAIVAAATIMHPAGDPQVGDREASSGYAELPGRPVLSASPGASRSGSPSPGAGSVPAAVPPGAAALKAVYRQESARLGGYTGQITVSNPGAVPVKGWTVVVALRSTVSLPLLGTEVRKVDGAVHKQDGDSVTFTPVDATRVVAPQGQVVFTFDVDGVGKPRSCTVDGRPCDGVEA